LRRPAAIFLLSGATNRVFLPSNLSSILPASGIDGRFDGRKRMNNTDVDMLVVTGGGVYLGHLQIILGLLTQFETPPPTSSAPSFDISLLPSSSPSLFDPVVAGLHSSKVFFLLHRQMAQNVVFRWLF